RSNFQRFGGGEPPSYFLQIFLAAKRSHETMKKKILQKERVRRI
ncbi:hypothetical protein AVEN_168529-1, partial [Araneus ventricosus]